MKNRGWIPEKIRYTSRANGENYRDRLKACEERIKKVSGRKIDVEEAKGEFDYDSLKNAWLDEESGLDEQIFQCLRENGFLPGDPESRIHLLADEPPGVSDGGFMPGETEGAQSKDGKSSPEEIGTSSKKLQAQLADLGRLLAEQRIPQKMKEALQKGKKELVLDAAVQPLIEVPGEGDSQVHGQILTGLQCPCHCRFCCLLEDGKTPFVTLFVNQDRVFADMENYVYVVKAARSMAKVCKSYSVREFLEGLMLDLKKEWVEGRVWAKREAVDLILNAETYRKAVRHSPWGSKVRMEEQLRGGIRVSLESPSPRPDVRLSIGDLSDGFALDHLSGMNEKLIAFLGGQRDVVGVFCTRNPQVELFRTIGSAKNAVVRVSLAPREWTEKYEPDALPLEERLETIRQLQELENGPGIELSLGPVPGTSQRTEKDEELRKVKEEYRSLLEQIVERLDATRIDRIGLVGMTLKRGNARLLYGRDAFAGLDSADEKIVEEIKGDARIKLGEGFVPQGGWLENTRLAVRKPSELAGRKAFAGRLFVRPMPSPNFYRAECEEIARLKPDEILFLQDGNWLASLRRFAGEAETRIPAGIDIHRPSRPLEVGMYRGFPQELADLVERLNARIQEEGKALVYADDLESPVLSTLLSALVVARRNCSAAEAAERVAELFADPEGIWRPVVHARSLERYCENPVRLGLAEVIRRVRDPRCSEGESDLLDYLWRYQGKKLFGWIDALCQEKKLEDSADQDDLRNRVEIIVNKTAAGEIFDPDYPDYGGDGKKIEDGFMGYLRKSLQNRAETIRKARVGQHLQLGVDAQVVPGFSTADDALTVRVGIFNHSERFEVKSIRLSCYLAHGMEFAEFLGLVSDDAQIGPAEKEEPEKRQAEKGMQKEYGAKLVWDDLGGLGSLGEDPDGPSVTATGVTFRVSLTEEAVRSKLSVKADVRAEFFIESPKKERDTRVLKVKDIVLDYEHPSAFRSSWVDAKTEESLDPKILDEMGTESLNESRTYWEMEAAEEERRKELLGGIDLEEFLRDVIDYLPDENLRVVMRELIRFYLEELGGDEEELRNVDIVERTGLRPDTVTRARQRLFREMPRAMRHALSKKLYNGLFADLSPSRRKRVKEKLRKYFSKLLKESEARDWIGAVNLALEQIEPEKAKEIFLCRDKEGLGFAQISEEMALASKEVRALYQNGKEQYIQHLRDAVSWRDFRKLYDELTNALKIRVEKDIRDTLQNGFPPELYFRRPAPEPEVELLGVLAHLKYQKTGLGQKVIDWCAACGLDPWDPYATGEGSFKIDSSTYLDLIQEDRATEEVLEKLARAMKCPAEELAKIARKASEGPQMIGFRGEGSSDEPVDELGIEADAFLECLLMCLEAEE